MIHGSGLLDKSRKIQLRPVFIQHWNDEYLVYNNLTADTHLLDTISGELIVEMAKTDLSKKQIVDYLLENYNDIQVQNAELYIDNIIEKFYQMELLDTEV